MQDRGVSNESRPEMSRMKVIAIEDADTWPVVAVLADLDDPEGPLLRWRQGPRANATTLDVRELLGDRSWRSWTSTSRPTGRRATWRPGEGRSGSSAEHPSRFRLYLDGC
jgi:hypothetical protein